MSEPGQREGLSGAELLRKLIHMAVGLGAFLVVLLGPLYSAALASFLLCFNLFILPRFGGRALWRRRDTRRGVAAGIVLYPLVLLVLVLIFWRRLEVVAAVWAILAFGDGMAAIVGRVAGGVPALSWNPAKSWPGLLAFWILGALGAAAALGWTWWHQGVPIEPGFLIAASAATALLAAWIESQPQKLDDNLAFPLLSAGFLAGVLHSESYWYSVDWPALLAGAGTGIAINLALAGAAYLARAIDVSGAVAGIVLGATIYTFIGWPGLVTLAAFVALGTVATRIGYRHKVRRHLAQEHGGRRGAANAIANGGVASVLAVLATTTPHGELYLFGFVGAFAAAASDTSSSEIGQLWGRRTILVTTGRSVPPGTDGGVSVAGTLAGLAGAAVIAVLGWALGFYPLVGIVAVTVAGVLGTFADSLAGATLERRGLLDNHGVNVLGTLIGALTAAALAQALL